MAKEQQTEKELTPFESIIKIQSEIKDLKKDTNNPFFKSKYMNLSSIVNTIKPILHNNNCFTTHEVIEEDGRMKLWSKICYKDGVVLLQCKSPLLTKDPNDPQKLGSAITYMRRYNLTAMLEIEEDDDDGNNASQDTKKRSDKENFQQISDKDMKETLKKYNEKDFIRIKEAIEDCGSVAEIDALIQNEKQTINKLRKYENNLFEKLRDCSMHMKSLLDPEQQEHNVMQAG